MFSGERYDLCSFTSFSAELNSLSLGTSCLHRVDIDLKDTALAKVASRDSCRSSFKIDAVPWSLANSVL